VKPCRSQSPPRTMSALWRCGARLAGVFPRPGRRKHGGATNGRIGRSYNGPPCAQETPLARYLSQLHCAGLYVRGGGPALASNPFLSRQTDRQTDSRPMSSRTSTLDLLRRSSLELCSPRYGTQLGGYCRNCSSAAWGNAEFCTSRLHRIPYYDYTGSMSGAVYVCPPSATVHKVLYYPDAWF
jgi:hypothetical protein